jgi:hypothetical protein
MKGRTLLILLLPLLALPLAFSAPEARVVDPRYSVPVAVLPGQAFNATLAGAESVAGAWLLAPGVNASLRVAGTWLREGKLVVQLETPKGAKPGLYDLCFSAGGVVCEPRSVWVLEREPERLTVAHLTDIHVEVVVDGVRSTLYFETAVNLVNSLPVDAVVFTGDNVDIGSDIDSLKKFRSLANRVAKPTFVIPGNHDHAQTDEKSFSELYYGAYVGPAYWYRVVGPFLLVGLDTGYAGYVDSNQLKWLESVLAAHRGKVKVLLMHHPLFRANLFREINGSWREIDKLQPYLYASWADRIDEARELLRLIEEYGVAAVLAGHVHTDGLVVYNGRTWFVTTVTACGSGDYRGFKLVEIGRDGSVKVVGLPGRNPLREQSSFVLDGSLVRVVESPDRRASTVVAQLSPNLGLELPELTIHLLLNATQPAGSYRVYGNSTLVKSLEILPYGGLYAAKLALTAPKGAATVTVAAYEDREPPTVSLLMYTPRKPVAGRDSVTLYIKAEDGGWGVRGVRVEYAADTLKGAVEARETGPGSYRAELPPLNASKLRVTAVAVDFAGNAASDTVEIEYAQPPKPQEQQAQPSQQQQQQQPSQQPAPQAPAQPQPLPAQVIAVAAVAVAVAIVAAVLLRRRAPKGR